MTRPAGRARLRPSGSDELGLRRALSDRLLPLVVGAMAFLAALALAGVLAAAALARHWQQGAAAALTVQVPDPGVGDRLGRVVATLAATPGIASARPLPAQELEALLAPWLGRGEARIALPIPGVVAVRTGTPPPDLAAVAARVQAEAPGSSVEGQGEWVGRLLALARSLEACAALAMGVVAAVAVAMVVVATRAGLGARRDAIEIVHGLGASDRFIAGRFARRITRMVAVGGLAGAVLALPVLLSLVRLGAPFAGGPVPEGLVEAAAALPLPLWLGLPAMPLLAASVAWGTAQATVRRWLRRLP